MKIWLIQLGETLPIDDSVRKMRTSMLADKLIENGHEVLWWTSAFEHARKQYRYSKDTKIELKKGLTVYAIKGIGYKKHISMRRFIDHRIIAHKFLKFANREERPDLILTSTPPYDVASNAVKFANKNGIPTIVDIRDEWPDLFLQRIPKVFRIFARVLLHHEFNICRKAFKNATCVTSMMESLLNWGLKKASRNKTHLDRVFYLGTHRYKYEGENSNKLEFLEHLKESFIAVYIGTFVYNTYPSIYIEAARLLKDENIHFVLAGDGELISEIKKQANDLTNVTVTGWLNKNEVSVLLHNSHVGLNSAPGFREAFSNKVFSYLSADLPIVSSYQGELRDIVENEKLGLYYSPKNAIELKDCLVELYRNKSLYEQMKGNVTKNFEEKFNADKIYNDFAKHIENCVKEYNE